VAGAYVEVVASTSAAWLLAGVGISPSSAFESFGHSFAIDVAVGASGSENVIGTFRGAIFGTVGIGRGLLLSPILIDAVASGSRVAVRVRESSTNTGTYNVTLHYYEQPVTGSLPSTTQPLLTLPEPDGVTMSSSGTTWANGSYVEIAAALATDIVIVGLVYGDVNNGADYEIDLATGGAGSESVIATVRDQSYGITNSEPFFVPLGVPIAVASGTRLAARLRSSPGSTSAFLALWYFEGPLGAGVSSSGLTTQALRVAPSASTVTPTIGTGGAYGDWVEVITTAAADLALAGFSAAAEGHPYDIQIGVGADGAEVPIATFKRSGGGSGSQTDSVFLPTPISDAIPSGSRVAVRIRSDSTIAGGQSIALYYYEDFTSDNVTPATIAGWPDAGSLAALTPSGTAWTSSAWVELENATTEPLSLYGIPFDTGVDAEYEFDLGIGAAGSESVIATIHGYTSGGQGTELAVLPALIPLAIGTRVAVRGRRNSTDTGAVFAAGAVYYGPPTPDAVVGGIALGYRGTVQSSRSVIVSLDGNANVLNEVGKMKVFGDFEVTGTSTIPGIGSISQLTGDVTAGPGTGSQAATIPNDTVTYAKMQNVSAASKLLGRGSASGAGDPEEITVCTGLTMTGTTLTASASAPALDDLTDVAITSPATDDVLQYDGTGWVNGPAPGGSGGALVLLEQHTASASASLDFTSFISSTYDTYLIVGTEIVPASSAADLRLEIGTGGTPTYDTGNNYEWASHGFATNGASVNDSGSPGIARLLASMGNTSGWSGQFSLTAFGLQSTSLRKTFSGTTYFINSSPLAVQSSFGMQWTTTGTAVTALRFAMSSGNIASGTIRIYGIAK
jgi:hypothetical protein